MAVEFIANTATAAPLFPTTAFPTTRLLMEVEFIAIKATQLLLIIPLPTTQLLPMAVEFIVAPVAQ